MQRIQRNFVIVEYVEVGIILTVAIVALFLKVRPGLAGVALVYSYMRPFSSRSICSPSTGPQTTYPQSPELGVRADRCRIQICVAASETRLALEWCFDRCRARHVAWTDSGS